MAFPIYDHYSHFDTILILHNKMGGSQDCVAQVDPDITHCLTWMTSYLRHDIIHLMSPGYLLPHVTLDSFGTNTYVNLFLYLCESFPYNKYVLANF